MVCNGSETKWQRIATRTCRAIVALARWVAPPGAIRRRIGIAMALSLLAVPLPIGAAQATAIEPALAMNPAPLIDDAGRSVARWLGRVSTTSVDDAGRVGRRDVAAGLLTRFRAQSAARVARSEGGGVADDVSRGSPTARQRLGTWLNTHVDSQPPEIKDALDEYFCTGYESQIQAAQEHEQLVQNHAAIYRRAMTGDVAAGHAVRFLEARHEDQTLRNLYRDLVIASAKLVFSDLAPPNVTNAKGLYDLWSSMRKGHLHDTDAKIVLVTCAWPS